MIGQIVNDNSAHHIGVQMCKQYVSIGASHVLISLEKTLRKP